MDALWLVASWVESANQGTSIHFVCTQRNASFVPGTEKMGTSCLKLAVHLVRLIPGRIWSMKWLLVTRTGLTCVCHFLLGLSGWRKKTPEARMWHASRCTVCPSGLAYSGETKNRESLLGRTSWKTRLLFARAKANMRRFELKRAALVPLTLGSEFRHRIYTENLTGSANRAVQLTMAGAQNCQTPHFFQLSWGFSSRIFDLSHRT